MYHASYKMFLRLIATIWLAGIFSQTAFAQGLVDDFNSEVPNTALWTPTQVGGPTVSLGNCKVNIFLPSTSLGDPFWAGYQTVLFVEGDFDVQVDYTLHAWPLGNGVRLGLSAYPTEASDNGIAVERTSLGNNDFNGYPREVYLAHYPPDSPQGLTGTGDRKGTLRLIREGDICTSYYWNSVAKSWTVIYAAPVFSGAAYFSISAWSHDQYFTQRQVRVSFNNFRVNSGIMNCPITPLGLEAPLGDLVEEGGSAPSPKTAFKRGQSLPLRLRQTFMGQALTSTIVRAPQIVALSCNGQSLDISNLHLDAKDRKSNNLTFASVGKKWIYQLRTAQLLAGNYIITLEMSDGHRYDASFVLK